MLKLMTLSYPHIMNAGDHHLLLSLLGQDLCRAKIHFRMYNLLLTQLT